MKRNIYYAHGTNVRDFFIIPTIRYNDEGCLKYLTFEWLNFYIGVSWDYEEE